MWSVYFLVTVVSLKIVTNAFATKRCDVDISITSLVTHMVCLQSDAS
jgi:hypothetical protein